MTIHKLTTWAHTVTKHQCTYVKYSLDTTLTLLPHPSPLHLPLSSPHPHPIPPLLTPHPTHLLLSQHSRHLKGEVDEVPDMQSVPEDQEDHADRLRDELAL